MNTFRKHYDIEAEPERAGGNPQLSLEDRMKEAIFDNMLEHESLKKAAKSCAEVAEQYATERIESFSKMRKEIRDMDEFDKEQQSFAPVKSAEEIIEEQESAFVDMLIEELPQYGIDTSTWEYDHGDCCYGGAVEFLARCIKAQGSKEKDGWISVKDSLPKTTGAYFAVAEDMNGRWTLMVEYDIDSNMFYSAYKTANRITHWQPLPAAPKN
jgi:hypothetical protein